MKSKVAVIWVSFFCLLWNSNVIAGGSEIAFKLLAKFAIAVATSVASDVAIGKVREFNGKDEEIDNKQEIKISGYRFQIQWLANDGLYSGALSISNEGAGEFRVTCPKGQIIDQDMVARVTNGNIILNGSNPRFAGTGSPIYNYAPDRFHLVNTARQGWIIADTCDYSGQCAPVTLVSASTF